jgi:hypothetical protein
VLPPKIFPPAEKKLACESHAIQKSQVKTITEITHLKTGMDYQMVMTSLQTHLNLLQTLMFHFLQNQSYKKQQLSGTLPNEPTHRKCLETICITNTMLARLDFLHCLLTTTDLVTIYTCNFILPTQPFQP